MEPRAPHRSLGCDIVRDMLLHQDPVPDHTIAAAPLHLHLQACAACRGLGSGWFTAWRSQSRAE